MINIYVQLFISSFNQDFSEQVCCACKIPDAIDCSADDERWII